MQIIKARFNFERSVRLKDPTLRYKKSKSNPYLTVVISGRNDGYGVDFLGRLRMFMKVLDHQVEKYPGLIELVIVEWNPLDDRESLRDVIYLPENYPVRIITVPPDIHRSLGSTYPVLEFYAKNVGARRARGEFVLTTNPDIIFSQSMIDFFARRDLDPDVFYRTDRYDFDGTGINDVTLEDLEKWIVPRVFIAHVTDQSVSSSIPKPPNLLIKDLLQLPKSIWDPYHVHSNGAGDFILASREAFYTVGGLWESTQQRWHIDSYSCYRFFRLGFDQYVFTTPCCIFHTDHPRSDMDQDIEQQTAETIVSAPMQAQWGLKDLDLPEWSPE